MQLSAINVKDSENKNCEAYRLADYYMTTYYPEWHKRYPTVVKPTSKYLNFIDKNNRFGVFHFDRENILTDPDNFYSKSAKEILKILYQ